MNSPSTMAQPQPPNHAQQQRPQFSPTQYNQPPRDFQAPHVRSNSFNATSPQMLPNYSSPSPHQFSPNMSQAPPPKRPRLSPDAPSPFSNPTFSPVGTPQAASPSNGTPTISTPVVTSRPGLMAPPQRPVEKEDRSYDDILSGTGINIEEEQRNLTRNDYFVQPFPQSSSQTGLGSFDSYQTTSFGQTSNSSFGAGLGSSSQSTEFAPEHILQREHERADWEAARHSQHPLWDMFLFGGTLNDKIKKISQDEHMTDPQTGVLVNTQKNAPPPVVRVNGLEGASRVIDKGQSILDTRDKAERLSDILKLLSLATKARLTGFLNASARLSFERREHSKGRVPEEWTAMAAVQPADKEANADDDAGANSSISMKRTHSQANSEAASPGSTSGGPHAALASFEKATQRARSAEEARLAKRAKRTAATKAQDNKDGENSETVEQMVANMNAEAEKKTTKKERKIADAKLNEQQQHKSANEAARMATSGLIGRGFGGKKSKSYSWMTGGGGSGSAASTPGRPAGSTTSTPVTGTPTAGRQPAVPRGRRFAQWDEGQDPGIQARDVLSVLESDGKAARSYVKGCSLMDT